MLVWNHSDGAIFRQGHVLVGNRPVPICTPKSENSSRACLSHLEPFEKDTLEPVAETRRSRCYYCVAAR